MNEENTDGKTPPSLIDSDMFVWLLIGAFFLLIMLIYLFSQAGAQSAMRVVHGDAFWRWGVPFFLITISFQLGVIIQKLGNLKS